MFHRAPCRVHSNTPSHHLRLHSSPWFSNHHQVCRWQRFVSTTSMSRPTGRRSSTWQCGALTTIWPSISFKTKDLIVEVRKTNACTPISHTHMEIEGVTIFKCLGVSEGLSWSLNTEESPPVSSDSGEFYHCTIKTILITCITVLFCNCSVLDRKTLQRAVTAQRIPTLHDGDYPAQAVSAEGLQNCLGHPSPQP